MPCSRNQFKIAAIVFMLIDHIGMFLLNNNILFRLIGRLAFPMFVYLLADGYRRTKDLKRYLARLLSLFLISFIPYSLAMSGRLVFYPLNIYASLFTYMIMYWFLDKDELPAWGKCLIGVTFSLLAIVLQLQYSWYGVTVAIVMFYMHQMGVQDSCFALMLLGLIYGMQLGFPLQAVGGLCVYFVPIQGNFVASPKPNKALQLVSYLFYPVHLMFFAVLRL